MPVKNDSINPRALRDGLYIQKGNTLYKVSSVYPHRFTATLVYPIPQRTTVENFKMLDLHSFKPASQQIINKADDAYAGVGE